MTTATSTVILDRAFAISGCTSATFLEDVSLGWLLKKRITAPELVFGDDEPEKSDGDDSASVVVHAPTDRSKWKKGTDGRYYDGYWRDARVWTFVRRQLEKRLVDCKHVIGHMSEFECMMFAAALTAAEERENAITYAINVDRKGSKKEETVNERFGFGDGNHVVPRHIRVSYARFLGLIAHFARVKAEHRECN